MKGIFIIFLFCCSPVFSQKIYKSHEVERPAAPGGGEELFNHFVNSNLRVPIKSSFRGLNRRVFVNGIVEPDGSLSELRVLKGLDSLCDQEAVRVLQLYKAWKPAMVKDVPVRQAVALPVVFKSDPVPAYDSAVLSLVTYFDKNWMTTSLNEKPKYRRFIPVDDFGFINGDVSFQKIEDVKWAALGSYPLTVKEFWKKKKYDDKTDSVLVFQVSANYEVGNQPIFQSLEKDEKGQILNYREFSEENKLIMEKSYSSDGVLKEMTIHGKDIKQSTYWYANGQLSGIFEMPQLYVKPYMRSVKEYYDPNGKHLVKSGNGYFVHHRQGIMEFDGNGAVRNGVKEGVWTAKAEDSTLVYEEHYSKGILTKGTSYFDGEKFEYTEVEIQPEFAGGIPSMYKYLAQNIKYPKDASKNNISGRVFTSFVVCEDGTLCDFSVLKGVSQSIDNEALRVIEGMSGKWQPGWQRGRKVRVKYNLPINFQLN